VGKPQTEAEENRMAKAKQHFKSIKGPDFVSRLRGYVNIKGPNPTSGQGDEVYVIRRALLLRTLIEIHHKEIIDPTTKELPISAAVLDAFLRVGGGQAHKGYLHGARSMEAVVSLSQLRQCRQFGPSELPARDVAELHVAPDFWNKVTEKARYHLSVTSIDRIARTIHENWMKTKAGYVYGRIRDDHTSPPTHPLMVKYEKLTEQQKELNRKPARLTAMRLEALGYLICTADQVAGKPVGDLKSLPLDFLARSEHRRWMREKLMEGGSYAEKTFDALLLHKDICRFDDLPASEVRLDDEIMKAILSFLKENDLVLVKAADVAVRQPPN
jgi:hypothetical protein